MPPSDEGGGKSRRLLTEGEKKHIIIIMLIFKDYPSVTFGDSSPDKWSLAKDCCLLKVPVGSVGAFDFVKGVPRTPALPDKVSLAQYNKICRGRCQHRPGSISLFDCCILKMKTLPQASPLCLRGGGSTNVEPVGIENIGWI